MKSFIIEIILIPFIFLFYGIFLGRDYNKVDYDFNNDGKIDMVDVSILLNHLDK